MVEILLATYNGGEYIEDLLESLLSQTYQEWVVVIHDDGSKDCTVQIIRKYCIAYPDKITVLDDGIICGSAKDNFSHLMRFANSDYIMFCDQDDVWFRDKIAVTLKEMQRAEFLNPGLPVLVHTDLEIVDDQLNSLSRSMFAYQKLNKTPKINELYVQNSITGCTVMINSMALRCSIPVPQNAIMHDWWIGLNVLLNGGCVAFVDKPTLMYRQHGNNEMGARKISLGFFVEKSKCVKKSILDIYLQANEIKKVSIVMIVLRKAMVTISRLLR